MKTKNTIITFLPDTGVQWSFDKTKIKRKLYDSNDTISNNDTSAI